MLRHNQICSTNHETQTGAVFLFITPSFADRHTHFAILHSQNISNTQSHIATKDRQRKPTCAIATAVGNAIVVAADASS